MDSLEPTCTPLKQSYDGCFNRWFERYLSLTTSHPSSSDPSSASASSSSRGRRAAAATGGGGDDRVRKMQAMKDEYDRDCGEKWKAYQSCLFKAIEAKGIKQLLDDSRTDQPLHTADGLAFETEGAAGPR